LELAFCHAWSTTAGSVDTVGAVGSEDVWLNARSGAKRVPISSGFRIKMQSDE